MCAHVLKLPTDLSFLTDEQWKLELALITSVNPKAPVSRKWLGLYTGCVSSLQMFGIKHHGSDVTKGSCSMKTFEHKKLLAMSTGRSCLGFPTGFGKEGNCRVGRDGSSSPIICNAGRISANIDFDKCCENIGCCSFPLSFLGLLEKVLGPWFPVTLL